MAADEHAEGNRVPSQATAHQVVVGGSWAVDWWRFEFPVIESRVGETVRCRCFMTRLLCCMPPVILGYPVETDTRKSRESVIS